MECPCTVTEKYGGQTYCTNCGAIKEHVDMQSTWRGGANYNTEYDPNAKYRRLKQFDGSESHKKKRNKDAKEAISALGAILSLPQIVIETACCMLYQTKCRHTPSAFTAALITASRSHKLDISLKSFTKLIPKSGRGRIPGVFMKNLRTFRKQNSIQPTAQSTAILAIRDTTQLPPDGIFRCDFKDLEHQIIPAGSVDQFYQAYCDIIEILTPTELHRDLVVSHRTTFVAILDQLMILYLKKPLKEGDYGILKCTAYSQARVDKLSRKIWAMMLHICVTCTPWISSIHLKRAKGTGAYIIDKYPKMIEVKTLIKSRLETKPTPPSTTPPAMSSLTLTPDSTPNPEIPQLDPVTLSAALECFAPYVIPRCVRGQVSKLWRLLCMTTLRSKLENSSVLYCKVLLHQCLLDKTSVPSLAQLSQADIILQADSLVRLTLLKLCVNCMNWLLPTQQRDHLALKAGVHLHYPQLTQPPHYRIILSYLSAQGKESTESTACSPTFSQVTLNKSAKLALLTDTAISDSSACSDSSKISDSSAISDSSTISDHSAVVPVRIVRSYIIEPTHEPISVQLVSEPIIREPQPGPIILPDIYLPPHPAIHPFTYYPFLQPSSSTSQPSSSTSQPSSSTSQPSSSTSQPSSSTSYPLTPPELCYTSPYPTIRITNLPKTKRRKLAHSACPDAPAVSSDTQLGSSDLVSPPLSPSCSEGLSGFTPLLDTSSRDSGFDSDCTIRGPTISRADMAGTETCHLINVFRRDRQR